MLNLRMWSIILSMNGWQGMGSGVSDERSDALFTIP